MIRRMSWSRSFFLLFLLLSAAYFLYRSDVAAQGVRDGLLLCARSVIPSLFPMLVAVTMAVQCGLGRLFPPACSALVLGLVGGYPVGAKTVAELYRSGDLDCRQAQRTLCCCNNCGGAFILGVVGRGVFGSERIGWALWAIHVAVSLVCALFLLPRTQQKAQPQQDAPCDFVGAVRSAAGTMVQLCGFVIFFLSALRLLSAATGISHPLLLGFFELTAGCAALPPTRQGFSFGAMMIGWGGISVHAQTASVLSQTPLRLRDYLACKALQSLLAGAAAYLAAPWLC